MFYLLAYQRVVLRPSVARDGKLGHKKEATSKRREKLLKTMPGSEKLETSSWRACTDVSLLYFKEAKREEDKLVILERSFWQSGKPAV